MILIRFHQTDFAHICHFLLLPSNNIINGFFIIKFQWTAPTYMVNVEDTRLRGAGSTLKRQIWDAARDTIQEWTGEELTDCSLYGIRVYTEGSVLATHVDRLPLVSSAILNVDQDVDEPWPIEVYAHDGKAYNVTMEPGDMVSGRDDEKRVFGAELCVAILLCRLS